MLFDLGGGVLGLEFVKGYDHNENKVRLFQRHEIHIKGRQ
jgi:hypothetical protein